MSKKGSNGKKIYKHYPERVDSNRGFCTPHQLCLDADAPGFFFGDADQRGYGSYVGMPQGADGNILVIGGNGSGKSSGIVKPTLETWRGAICATDIKGELSSYYTEVYQRASKSGKKMRPYIIFDPTQPDGLSYDPFWWLLQDDMTNLYSNIKDIVLAMIPKAPNDPQPFWIEAEQSILTVGLIYYFKLGLSFSESICALLRNDLYVFFKEISSSDTGSDVIIPLLGMFAKMKPETLACIDRELRDKLHPFAADPYISHAFRGEREGAACFNWRHLDQVNVFLRIPQNRIDQWGGAVNLMYTQLIRYLECKPERYSAEGQNNVQTLVLMDEFPRFGKLELFANTLPTLRSKNVNICLVVQSLAQLDMLYGTNERRTIFDNCQYQAILRANDAETQEILSRLIGSTSVLLESVSRNLDESGEKTGYSTQRSIGREPRVFPHELSTLTDVLLISPCGVSRLEKRQPSQNLYTNPDDHPKIPFNKKGVKMLMVEERTKNAIEKIARSKKAQYLAAKNELNRKEHEDKLRKFIVGELVITAFPELLNIVPAESKAETESHFRPLEQFLAALAADPVFTGKIEQAFAAQTVQCVSGQREPATNKEVF